MCNINYSCSRNVRKRRQVVFIGVVQPDGRVIDDCDMDSIEGVWHGEHSFEVDGPSKVWHCQTVYTAISTTENHVKWKPTTRCDSIMWDIGGLAWTAMKHNWTHTMFQLDMLRSSTEWCWAGCKMIGRFKGMCQNETMCHESNCIATRSSLCSSGM